MIRLPNGNGERVLTLPHGAGAACLEEETAPHRSSNVGL
jgi:hypothetical protein